VREKTVAGTVILVSLLLFAVSSMGRLEGSTQIPIQHFVFIVQENHSYDNYFGAYCNVQTGLCGNGDAVPGAYPAGVRELAPSASEIADTNESDDGNLRIDWWTNTTVVRPFDLGTNTNISLVGDELPPGIADPEDMPNGTSINDLGDIGITGVPDDYNFSQVADVDNAAATSGTGPFPLTNESIKCCTHSWETAHAAWDDGRMDGFVSAENNIDTMGYYTRQEIPYYWDYADNYVLDDDFYSSLMGPSFPNHLYIVSGQSGGQVDNTQYTWSNGTVSGCAGATAKTWRSSSPSTRSPGSGTPGSRTSLRGTSGTCSPTSRTSRAIPRSCSGTCSPPRNSLRTFAPGISRP
jgi:phospholipase C